MRVRVGVDILEVSRMERLVTENPGIIQTVLTEQEFTYCSAKRRRYEHMAARFAAKEAVLKAFGTGVGQRMRWTDVEVINGVTGRPRICLHGEVARWAEQHGVSYVDISLSHTATMAIAQAAAVWQRDSGGEGDPDALSAG